MAGRRVVILSCKPVLTHENAVAPKFIAGTATGDDGRVLSPDALIFSSTVEKVGFAVYRLKPGQGGAIIGKVIVDTSPVP